MEFLSQYGFVILGVIGGLLWLVMFVNRDKIESPWIRAFLGLSLEDPLLKAAMQGRKDFSRREWLGWGLVILFMVAAFVFTAATK